MRNYERLTGGGRASALWGKRSGSRASALWGKGGRGAMALLGSILLVGAAAVPAGAADNGRANKAHAKPDLGAFVTPTLLHAAEKNPAKTFSVIVQGDADDTTREVSSGVSRSFATDPKRPKIKRSFLSVSGVGATLTGEQIVKLAKKPFVAAITPDAPVELSGTTFSNPQKWAYVAGVAKFWRSVEGGVNLPAIAVVDSGIEKGRADFGNGSGVRHEVVLTGLENNSPGDGRGHGTFVAGIAAGQAKGYAGAVPTAPIVSLDVMDDSGKARTSDVIAAADWILRNKSTYNIRVANFSLHSAVPSSFVWDPLDQAVEKLWFNGVVVVAAAGNYGSAAGQSGVLYAPGNDPFVITVGANDIDGSLPTNDDEAAPWSAYGYTLDGFAKPEIGAPGRYMVGPVPAASTLALERPGQMRAPGYIELSGTSFAAPLVSGVAAYLLAINPTWTPDQVKGALMLTAKPARLAKPLSLGVGELDGPRAADYRGTPPNPNVALNRFLVADATGAAGPVFDAASWANVAQADASWASASWASASWASASWASASWASASWASASWASASWASNAEASASWASASWASSSYEDNAEGEGGVGGEIMTPEEILQAELALGISEAGDTIAP